MVARLHQARRATTLRRMWLCTQPAFFSRVNPPQADYFFLAKVNQAGLQSVFAATTS
jgi:hypothetical protein